MPVALGKTGGTAFTALGTLAGPGVSDFVDLSNVEGETTIQVTVADIGTNVVVRLEGSLDGLNYFALEDDRTITADGTIGLRIAGRLKFARCSLVSISGGTPTVSFVAGGR